MRKAYLEKLEQMMKTVLTNQLHEIITSYLKDNDEITSFEQSMLAKRKNKRIEKLNEFNQRIKSLKKDSGFEEECK